MDYKILQWFQNPSFISKGKNLYIIFRNVYLPLSKPLVSSTNKKPRPQQLRIRYNIVSNCAICKMVGL